jgi:hypothetical protein
MELCETGELYEALAKEWDWDRAQVKKALFAYLFDRHWREYPVTARMRERFPTVHAFIGRMKARDYRHLSHMLQRAESRLIIGGVCRRMMEEAPEVFVATIHDSVLVPRAHEALLVRIMEEEFGRLGIRPTLKVKALRPPEAPGGPPGHPDGAGRSSVRPGPGRVCGSS